MKPLEPFYNTPSQTPTFFSFFFLLPYFLLEQTVTSRPCCSRLDKEPVCNKSWDQWKSLNIPYIKMYLQEKRQNKLGL